MEYADEYDLENEEGKEVEPKEDIEEKKEPSEKKEKTEVEKKAEEIEKEETPIAPMEKSEYTVIIDIGQGTTKVGLAGDAEPKTFPTVVGKPKYQQRMAGVEAQDLYVGNDTVTMRGVLKLEYPINRGQVMDWNHYYALLNHIFYNVLRIDPKKCNIIYIVPPLTPPDSSRYFARVLFETHQCKSVAIIDSASTSVFSVGETTGLNVELGEGLTTVTPVMDGRLYPPSIQRLNLAGVDILNYLQSLLSRYGVMHKREILKEIKEQACKIALNPEEAAEDSANDKQYTLPDGETLNVNAYVSTWTGEVLFQPSLLGQQQMSNLPQAIINSIRNTHQAYWRKLLKTIILSGGSSQFCGLKERLKHDLEQLVPQLGPIPETQPEPEPEPVPEPESAQPLNAEEGEKKMVQVKSFIDSIENCPKCGELLEGDSKFCPSCGVKLERQQLEIIGTAQQKFPSECSECGKKLDGNSPFCPFCGAKLEAMLEEGKVKWKERRKIKKAEAGEDELESILADVSEEYGGVEELEEIDKKAPEKDENSAPEEEEEEDVDDGSLVRIITPDDQAFASYKGASILGALPTFKEKMASHDQFKENPDSVLVDFSEIVGNL